MVLNHKVEKYFTLLQNKKYKEAEEFLGTLKEIINESKKGKG